MYNPFDPLDPARIPNYDAALRTTKSNVLQISMSTIMMYALDSLFYADFATDCDCRLARKGLREIKAMGGALAATPTDSPVHQTDLDSWMDKLAELRRTFVRIDEAYWKIDDRLKQSRLDLRNIDNGIRYRKNELEKTIKEQLAIAREKNGIGLFLPQYVGNACLKDFLKNPVQIYNDMIKETSDEDENWVKTIVAATDSAQTHDSNAKHRRKAYPQLITCYEGRNKLLAETVKQITGIVKHLRSNAPEGIEIAPDLQATRTGGGCSDLARALIAAIDPPVSKTDETLLDRHLPALLSERDQKLWAKLACKEGEKANDFIKNKLDEIASKGSIPFNSGHQQPKPQF